MATTRQTELDVSTDAPLWTYGSAAAKRAEESNTCENGVEGCQGPEERPEWDNADQCADCFEESFYIDWEESTDE